MLAKQAAREQGAREAWFVDREGRVTEGSSSNAWIVTRDGKVVTRQADHAILKGITRTVLLEAIAAQDLKLKNAPSRWRRPTPRGKAFITSASQIVLPVVKIDGRAGRQWRAWPDRVGVASRIPSPRKNLVNL